jgi:metal-responsive CopG/Arc/MetJ family transcriptional regulator
LSKQHGGKRPGAGRPLGHGEPTTSVQIRVPNSLLAAIDEAAAGREVSRNQIIIEALQASQMERSK